MVASKDFARFAVVDTQGTVLDVGLNRLEADSYCRSFNAVMGTEEVKVVRITWEVDEERGSRR